MSEPFQSEDTLPSALPPWWERILTDGSIHPALVVAVVLVLAVLAAKLVDWFVARVLRRLAQRTRLEIDDALVDLVHAPLTRSVLIVGMAVALGPIEIAEPWKRYTRSALLTIAVLLWVPVAFRAMSLVLRAASEDTRHFRAIEPRTYPLFDNLAKLLFFAAFTYLIFIQLWGIDPAGFLASAGIVGIAVGFAAQDTLANLFAGVFIIADAPYRVGDFITLDSGERGKVLNIGLRSTRLLTRDDIEITIPNSVMGKAKITNEAGGPSPNHRVRLKVSVAYGSDVDHVREVLVQAAADEERVIAKPEPRVRFRAFGDSGLHFELLCWIPEPVLRGATLDALHESVYKRFAAEDIEIPYPRRDVTWREAPPVRDA